MCFVLKYGIWNVSQPDMGAVNALAGCGYGPVTAMVLASRGLTDQRQAQAYLRCDAPLCDPYAMKDMDKAAARVGLAMTRGETVAVFGDYDVDGITATSLLTHFLRSCGVTCIPYIPGRLEEGYGLNPIAIHQLHQEGVSLIITVDCGITALEEARLCARLGIDLVITDHHECKEILPWACAVVDPHRPDDCYPHKNLSGVGVAFKLACALSGEPHRILEQYADMVCLGTVADVMPLQGENRVFVDRGLKMLRNTHRPGLAALIDQCSCDAKSLSASTIGFMLAPRINAAGRMGQIELALELFLTEDPQAGLEASRALCELNRQRQSVESEIYEQALSMLPEGGTPEAIVLADDSWHQGVVGIVASRIAEEFCCPTFLICLDGDHGKASSRSYGSFNLFAALTSLSPLLESYGGHELAAGFTIRRDQISAFREAICNLVRQHNQGHIPHTVLDVDCDLPAELLTLSNIQSLDALEPCGNGCPKPVLMMRGLTVDRTQAVSSGKHLRLRLRKGRAMFNAIYFSCGQEINAVQQGELIDVAFTPQINEFRDERTVQMNVLDLRPSCNALCDPELRHYLALQAGQSDASLAQALLPERGVLGTVWRYLAAAAEHKENPMCLLRKIVRWSGMPLSLEMLLVCLDIFSDVGLVQVQRHQKYLLIQVASPQQKADLNASATMQQLLSMKG